MRRTLFFMIVCAVLGGTAVAQKRKSPIKQPALRDTLRIVVIGSSTAAGSGAHPRDSAWVPRYRRYVQRNFPPAQVINLAHGGYNTYQLQPDWYEPPPNRKRPDSARNITMALRKRPHAIIMNMPTNDVASNIALEEKIANFERIAALCDSANVLLWVTSTQPRNMSPMRQQGLKLFREWTAVRFGDFAIDFWDGIASVEGDILPLFDSGDGVHVNNAGHGVLLSRVIEKDIPGIVRATSASSVAIPAPTVFTAFVSPNPFNVSTSFTVNVPRTTHVAITVADILDDTRRTVHYGLLPRGRHSIPAGMEGEGPGVYTYKIEAGREVRRGKLIKLP